MSASATARDIGAANNEKLMASRLFVEKASAYCMRQAEAAGLYDLTYIIDAGYASWMTSNEQALFASGPAIETLLSNIDDTDQVAEMRLAMQAKAMSPAFLFILGMQPRTSEEKILRCYRLFSKMRLDAWHLSE